MSNDLTVLASIARMTWEALQKRGCNSQTIFIQAGLDIEKLRDPLARYPQKQARQLMELAVEASEDPGFGLAIAEQWHPSHLNALGYAFLVSKTLKEALERMVRYSRLLTDYEQLSLGETPDSYRLKVIIPSPLDRAPDVTYDAFFATVVKMCRFNFGQHFKPKEVQLQRRAPPGVNAFYEFFLAPVRFLAPDNVLIFDNEDLQEPLLNADEALCRVHDRFIKKYLAEHDQQSIITRTKIELLRQLPSGKPSRRAVARSLNVSERSFQRRLEERGTSFHDLVDEVRCTLALGYLKKNRFSTKETAYLLGFSAPGHFSRAFKRWVGVSPSEYLRFQEDQNLAAAKRLPGDI